MSSSGYWPATTLAPFHERDRNEGQAREGCLCLLSLPASPHVRLLIGSQGPQKRVGGISDNCSCGLPTRCACSPAARSLLASVSPAPSLPPCWPEMAVAIATLLIQSEDNEANVFFIPMSWRAGAACRGGGCGGGSPPTPPSQGRDSRWGLTSQGQTLACEKGTNLEATKLSGHHGKHGLGNASWNGKSFLPTVR